MKDNNLKKQLMKFIVAGCCAVATDCIVYYILSRFFDLSVSKCISFLTGTIAAYLINKYYTFEQTRKSKSEVVRFLALYLSTLAANVFVNKISLSILPVLFAYMPVLNNFETVKLFAFLAATGTSSILNFIGQKYWVFKK